MKTISLLGSGWLGSALASYFQPQPFTVKASTRTPARLNQLQALGVTPCLVDIDNLSPDRDTLLDCDVLIINITSKNSQSYSELIGHIEASAVRRVLFVSSTSVYLNTNQNVRESAEFEDVNSLLYQIERLLIDNKHFQTTVVRMSGLIGPGRHPGRFFKNDKPVEQPDSPINLIHQTDCINIISRIIDQNAWGEVFNASAGNHPTKRDFYGQAKQALGLPPPTFASTSAPTFKIVDNQKVRRALNYEFVHDDLLALVSAAQASAFDI